MKSTHSSRAFSAIGLLVATVIGFSTSFFGVYEVEKSISGHLTKLAQNLRGHYTTEPIPAYLGTRPGRDPLGRGGIWSKSALRELTSPVMDLGLQASMRGYYTGGHTLAISAASGTSFPWEGSHPGAQGMVNTANGDKLTSLHLLSWKVRGGMTLDFTLYHNSQTSYEDELGHGWTWSYDIYVNNLTGNPIVHWGDGLAVPYTAPCGERLRKGGWRDR